MDLDVQDHLIVMSMHLTQNWFVVNNISSLTFLNLSNGRQGISRTKFYSLFLLSIQSKHLKGRLGPCVSDVTFFNHGALLGPSVSDGTFFNHGGQLFHGSKLVFHGSRWVFIVLHGSRLFFHGSKSVFMVFHDSRLVFHGSWSVFMIFHGWEHPKTVFLPDDPV